MSTAEARLASAMQVAQRELRAPSSAPLDPKQCGATRRDGQPCRNLPVKGTNRCRMHGGSAPQVKRKAERRLAQMKVKQVAARLLDATDANALEALVLELQRSGLTVEIYEQMVGDLHMDPADGEAIWGLDHKGDAKPHVLVSLWNDERDRHARFAKMALEAGVAERQVQIAEMQAGMIAGLIAAIIDDREAGLSPPQRLRMRHIAVKHLRELPP